jgi:hypothetical protein
MNSEYCIFIISYGRPENVKTYDTLIKQGCTANIYIICSSDDNQLDKYHEYYPNKVIVFDKEKYNHIDTMDNFNNKKIAIFARAACFDIAEKLKYKYFFQFDDDYSIFLHKFDTNLKFVSKKILNLDHTFELLLQFYKKTPAYAIAIAQGGDFIGGKNSMLGSTIYLKRKCMNTFLLSTERRFDFIGSMNADVNTYVKNGIQGKLFLQINQISINQEQTQKNKNGLTDIYKQFGTYVKSFYTVIINPSSVKISLMGNKNKRLHHKIDNNKTYPLILWHE